MAEIKDEQLVESFTESGEIRHFDELVSRHIGKVRAMIYPIVLNDADADDLTQEVFLRVVNNISRFRNRARFSTWLHRIALNTTYSFLKKRKRSPMDQREDLAEHPCNTTAPDRSLIAEETDSQVTEALASLSPSLRAAITLTAIHGMSTKEAAQTSDCLRATMYWRVHEARRILKTKLNLEVT